jgi:hypothetical protein
MPRKKKQRRVRTLPPNAQVYADRHANATITDQWQGALKMRDRMKRHSVGSFLDLPQPGRRVTELESLYFGGEGEIRTHEPREGPPVFKTGAINRSATSPRSVTL